ncbi:MAG: hypothetical protein RMI80_09645 [Meiothermus sp.]|nr:hypothetical protein [Meiothermus sp.]MDW8091662.1 hypothetical protein [Meiothermus sp.]
MPNQATMRTPVVVGPGDLYAAVAWLCSQQEASLASVAWTLRSLVDHPLETLELAERLDLAVQLGLRVAATPQGCGWVARPEVMPQSFAPFLAELPFQWVLGRLAKAGGRLSLVALSDRLSEAAAQALAEWGEWLGYWRLEAGWIISQEAA